jgi:hypothetical protein
MIFFLCLTLVFKNTEAIREKCADPILTKIQCHYGRFEGILTGFNVKMALNHELLLGSAKIELIRLHANTC